MKEEEKKKYNGYLARRPCCGRQYHYLLCYQHTLYAYICS